jgi:hypothetical protein
MRTPHALFLYFLCISPCIFTIFLLVIQYIKH